MSVLDQLLVYEDNEPRSAAANMALDEALLEIATSPSLRFYSWRKPAVSFGYFGCFTDVVRQYGDREIVRRWTGGGIVPHGDDLTYSIIIPTGHPLLAQSSLAIYTAIHNAIRHAFNANGIEAALADAALSPISNDCFANPVRADVISQGRKIAGAAHRRSRLGLLHQGSIQGAKLPLRFINDFARALCDRFERKALSPNVIERAEAIREMKYATTAWLMRR